MTALSSAVFFCWHRRGVTLRHDLYNFGGNPRSIRSDDSSVMASYPSLWTSPLELGINKLGQWKTSVLALGLFVATTMGVSDVGPW